MLHIAWMKPHKPNPVSRRIDVDISGILIRPENLRLTEISHDLDLGSTFLKQTDCSLGPRESRIGPFGWLNINFVVVSGLIALFCTNFIRDTFEYSRRRAHLPADASDLRAQFRSTTSQGFSLEPARLAAAVQLDYSKLSSPEEKPASIKESPAPSTLPQFRTDQILAPLPNNGGLADRTSTGNPNATNSESAAPARLSRATSTSSSAESSSSSGEQTGSKHSSLRTVTRHSRKSMTSARTTISSHRQSVRRSVANSFRISGAAKSAQHATRQNINSMTVGSHHGQSHAAKTQIGAAPGLMSMHSLGNGVGLRQSHGAMNPMRMESGMLAQPAVGAGLGGVSGNGLGGSGGNHGGNRVAK
jgi:hypothetical protein